MAAKIWETPEWAALKRHSAEVVGPTHLRDLMQVRCGHWTPVALWSYGAASAPLAAAPADVAGP
jgi:hypothetical protein